MMDDYRVMPSDTIATTTQTLTLNDFTVWNTNSSRTREILSRLTQVCSAAENYSITAKDLELCEGNSPAKCECAQLLQYYLTRFKRARDTALRKLLNEFHNTESVRNLQEFMLDIETSLKAMGIKLRPFSKGQQF